MKVVILNSKGSQQDLYTYGKDLLEQLQREHSTVMYDEVKPDFSNIPELFEEEEKIVLFNHFAFDDGFRSFSKYAPSFKNVKYLLSPYSSYEGLDLELLKKLGIRYRNNAGANAKSVAQYAITCMFMLLSRFPQFTSSPEMPDGSILGEEYHSKTAGIIGMGNVGQELLKTLKGLGIKTNYYNRTEKEVDAEKVSFEDVFKNDIVFITIATNPKTRELLSTITEHIQEKNYIVDVSAYDDLYDKRKVLELLENDKLRGYALENEMQLKSSKNFISTPHIAWCTLDAERRTVENYLNRALTIANGESEKIDFIV